MAEDRSEGRRIEKLQKQRDKMKEEMERAKQQIVKDSSSISVKVDDRFTVQHDDLASALAKDTVGLVTLTNFQAKQRELEARRAAEMAAAAGERPASDQDKKRAMAAKKAKQQQKTLSFTLEEDEESGDSETSKGVEEQPAIKKLKVGKNPHVDTSFLPDRDRELEEQRERERLANEWRDKQERIKQEEIEVTYSYWDGSGHRSSVVCKKGETISSFLEKARQQFPELRGVSVDNLMYIKEDLIVPQYYTFYDFIINKARGKSGPLFHFDVHDDVRVVADARIERDESHAGKVVERRWYERNKHIFPANRWETYDPEKDYGSYTIA